MLDVRTRQAYMKGLGFYAGEVDGKEGAQTKAAYKALQNKYFTREKDRDGKYGTDTDILLQCAYNMRGIKHFGLEELRCGCGGKCCTGYPAAVSRQLMKNLDYLREKDGHAIKVTSGLRCAQHNKNVGGASGSRHTRGQAADITSASLTGTKAKRKALIKRWKTFKASRYAYSDSGNMGRAVHLDVDG